MKEGLKKVLSWWPMFLLIMLAVGLSVGSCSHTRTKAEIDEDQRIINERVVSHIRVIEYDGHEYLLYEDGRVAGMTHSGSCKKCW